MLASALRDKLSTLAGVPAAMIPAAAASAAAAAADLLSFNLAEVLVDGWRGHNELTVAARRTLAAPGNTELVRLATHRITVTRQSYVRIVVKGQSVADVELGLTFVFDISAMTAGVSAGQQAALHSGRCSITATLPSREPRFWSGSRRSTCPRPSRCQRRARCSPRRIMRLRARARAWLAVISPRQRRR